MSDPKKIDIAEIRSLVSRVLEGEISFAVLLGSADTERFHAESDIDIAVYFKVDPTFEKLIQFKSLLADRLSYEVDLVALNKVDPIFARQVMETGRELEIVDRAFFNIWKARQLSTYPDFKDSRAVIEGNLLNRKKYV